MVSPELLRRFSFFNFLNDTQLKAVAMLAEEIQCFDKEPIVDSGRPANHFFFVVEGSAAYYCLITNEFDASYRKEYFINDINPGEVFGISALIEPNIYTATVRANEKSRLLRIDAAALRALCEVDPKLAYRLMRAVAEAALHRLNDTRTHLASARIAESVMA